MKKKIPVKEALDSSGYRKKYIAEKLELRPEYLSKFIKNSENISIKKALIICELTGLELSEIDFGV